ncbi:PREDICTED: putative RNA exonuclease NEF-sp [Ceratosolen solmsi marchali]|uniref:RNA exonuclease NEF-sp n=1 Tax=Ceratosolen solmsi marchali TaxID=326594 RepID=A0AAJ6YFV0_9HYME|nr:PREDICTED: putative RNA exonuclease NEF-sp [Ceratosolen solmsi marchali]
MVKMLTSLKDFKPPLLGEDFSNLKNRLRERKKILSSIPRLRLLSVGVSASLSLNINSQERIPIYYNDIQNLLLYSILGHNSPYLPERWCKLDKYNKISHTIVFVIEGLTVDHYLSNESLLRHVTSKLEYKLEIITSSICGSSFLEELINVPLTISQKSYLINKFGSLEKAYQNNRNIIKCFKAIFPIQSFFKIQINKKDEELPSNDKFSRTKLLLSSWQLIEENYPIPLKGFIESYPDYILTKDIYNEVHSKSQMFGLDCEMCQTINGMLEVTRVSIVDEELNIVYDTFVKPYNKIINYLTQYSGITKNILENVTTRLCDVQASIRALLPSDAILVGQSLNSDLNALKMMHPYIIDTSVIFNLSGQRTHKTKLKVLVKSFLNEQIQINKEGHCSIEDSKASIKLVKLKLAKSLNFGDSVFTELFHSNSNEFYFKTYEKCHVNEKSTSILSSSIFNHVSKIFTKTSAIFGSNEIVNDYSRISNNSALYIQKDQNFEKRDNVKLIITQNNNDTITRCSENAIQHNLNFCHIKLKTKQLSKENLSKTLSSVNKWIRMLWKHTELYGLMCVIFSGDTNSNGACFLNIKKSINTEYKK